MDVSGAILRRGVSAYLYQARDDKTPGAPDAPVVELPTWMMFMFMTTFVGFLFIMVMIDYTFGRLIPTLLIIESPDALFEPLPTIDPDSDEPSAAIEAEPVAAKQQTITSSFRGTLKLLHSKGGFPARFRGFSIFIVNAILFTLISLPLSAIPFLPRSVAGVLASVLMANMTMAWTHIVISEPSAKPWWRRVPGLRMYKKIVLPAAVLAVAEQLSFFLPRILARVYNFGKLKEEAPNMSGGRTAVVGLEALSIFIFGLALAFCLVIPSNVILTRVQASLLDDAEETIVPFDRSFGGKVVPEIVGGQGIVSMRDAWTTFDWASRLRLITAYAKVLAMQIAMFIVIVLVMALEIFVIAQVPVKQLIPGGNKGSDGEI